ncbi:metallopeptidase TldD-related protein [Rhodococcus sp. 1168]|uniref:metallopeptidase TldD-related protein n=1 Tax=Rhodococcus sp. 1168 TaxID=2018041 RepID=UPI000A09BAD4|nr:metallopeptidase TldD-related protein [Rhodococcus sp. 1168]ORI13552.1 hypothetical protein BJI47_23305 [Rhodococcus sp. 1168]
MRALDKLRTELELACRTLRAPVEIEVGTTDGYITSLFSIPGTQTRWGTRNQTAEAVLEAVHQTGLEWLADDIEGAASGRPLPARITADILVPPFLAAVLMHECIGHTSEADNYQAYRHRLEPNLGDYWTDLPLLVRDDPTEPGHSGSYRTDDEGTPAQPVTLVENGRWTDLLTSTRTAGTHQSNGHGRCLTPGGPPLPRMAFFTVGAGDSSYDSLLSNMDGFLLGGIGGGGSVREYMSIKPLWARRIIDGHITDESYTDLVLRAKKDQLVKRLQAIGDSPRTYDPLHPCCKEGQDLPITMAAPYLRLNQVILYPD